MPEKLRPITYSECEPSLNVRARSELRRESVLSNFSNHPFIFRGYEYACVEGFVQGIKYPEDDPTRALSSTLDGRQAKMLSPESPPSHIQWEGTEIPYGSNEHHLLQAAAIFAKFDQHPEALEILLSTGSMEITHNLGPENPHTCLPGAVFTRILTEIRAYHFAQMGAKIGLEGEPRYITPELTEYAREQ